MRGAIGSINFGPEQAILSVVLSAKHFKMGLTMPLHPFIVKILERYDHPNSSRMAICMYILYHKQFQVKLTANELGYFYQLKQTGKNSGSFYLDSWNIHGSKCIRGNKKVVLGCQQYFLYCYGCP